MYFKRILLLFLLLPINIWALAKAPIDITKLDLNELSKALDEGIITSENLIELYLDRINEYSSYNAIISINDKAIDEAKALDKERAQGKVRSILHGIPIIVKDNIDVKGLPTTAGAKALNQNYPDSDATVIAKLKKAGAIILAKSNMSEFAFLASSSRSTYGTVKNAYNQDYSSYGSSGGSAVSLALNLAPITLGTDTNSSIRVPASASNVLGYRPTLGLISREGVLPYDPERDTIGILAKSTNDAVIVANIIMGYDEKDDKSINQKYNNFKLTMTSLSGINIGVPTAFLKGSNDNKLPENKETYEEIYNLMVKAIDNMEKDGANIIYIDPYYTYNEDYEVANSYSGFLFCDSFNKYIKGTSGPIKSFSDLLSSKGKLNDLKNYASYCNTTKTLDEKNKNKSTYAEYLTKIYNDKKLDIIIYPTTKNKLLKIGASGLINTSAHAASTVGFPAISMPLGFDSDNLSYGIEFMALKGEDEKLFNIASVYEMINTFDSPAIAPSLYETYTEVNNLIKNYQSKQKIFLKSHWLKEVKEYFKNYNQNEDVLNEAKLLNADYTKRLYLNKLIKIGLVVVMYLYIRGKFRIFLRKKTRHDKLYNNRK